MMWDRILASFTKDQLPTPYPYPEHSLDVARGAVLFLHPNIEPDYARRHMATQRSKGGKMTAKLWPPQPFDNMVIEFVAPLANDINAKVCVWFTLVGDCKYAAAFIGQRVFAGFMLPTECDSSELISGHMAPGIPGGNNSENLAFASYLLMITLHIVDVINCANVHPVRVTPPRKMQKKRKKAGKLPLMSYYVLKLGSSAGSRPTSYGRVDTGGRSRVHLCRGHFKEYTMERPLLGRHVGRYWWQPYARGDAQKGIVVKDYEITAPP